MPDQTRHRYFLLLTALLVGLGLAWSALALLTKGGAPLVAHAQGNLRYVAISGMDAGSDCTDLAAPCATLQHAVDVASPGDEIRVAGGTYTDIHTRPAPAGYSGPAVISQVVYLDKSLVLRGGYTTTAFAGSPDPEMYPTTLDAEGQGRGLFMAGEITVTVEGLRFTGGAAAGLRGAGSHGYDTGGGVYVATGTAVISHSWVLSNVADFGGGLYLHQSTAILSNGTIISNTAVYEGGGLALDYSHATINSSVVSSNTAGLGGGGLGLENSVITLNDNLIGHNRSGYEGGGGLYLFVSHAVLINNIITSNTASFIGGGLVVYEDSTATLTGNTIISNQADILGGGVGVRYSQVALSGNVLVANSADYGGGLIVLDDSTAILTNNAIVANQANVVGSGLGFADSTVDGLHTTIAHNVGGDGSGIYISDNAAVVLTNTILSSQTLALTTTASSTAILDGVLWYGNATNIAGEGAIAVTNQYTGDPRFAADGYHLSPGSAAINRGVRAGVADDIDGQARDFAPDLGADEYPLEVRPYYLPIILRDW